MVRLPFGNAMGGKGLTGVGMGSAGHVIHALRR